MPQAHVLAKRKVPVSPMASPSANGNMNVQAHPLSSSNGSNGSGYPKRIRSPNPPGTTKNSTTNNHSIYSGTNSSMNSSHLDNYSSLSGIVNSIPSVHTNPSGNHNMSAPAPPTVAMATISNVPSLPAAIVAATALDMNTNMNMNMNTNMNVNVNMNALTLAAMEQRKLQFTIKPSTLYPFVDVWFPITIWLVDERNDIIRNTCIPFNMDLFYANGEICTQTDLFQIHPSTPLIINEEGSATLHVRFLLPTSAYGNQSLMMKAYTTNEGLSIPIQGFTTLPITPVRYRLKIVEQPPSLVYKDTPLRSFVIKALLVDQNDATVQINNMPLDVVLCYADTGAEVQKQSILYKLGSKFAKIDGGAVELKLRIDEVSKNHNGREFCIKLRSSLPMHSDIAPESSRPIDVKSRPRRVSKTNSQLLFQNGQNENVARAAQEIAAWCKLAHSSLMACEWQYEKIESVNPARSIYQLRCPTCGASREGETPVAHAENCSIFTAKDQYSQIQSSLQIFSSVFGDAHPKEESHSPRSATADTVGSNEMTTEAALDSSAYNSSNEADWFEANSLTEDNFAPDIISQTSSLRLNTDTSNYFGLQDSNALSNSSPAAGIQNNLFNDVQYSSRGSEFPVPYDRALSTMSTQSWLSNLYATTIMQIQDSGSSLL